MGSKSSCEINIIYENDLLMDIHNPIRCTKTNLFLSLLLSKGLLITIMVKQSLKPSNTIREWMQFQNHNGKNYINDQHKNISTTWSTQTGELATTRTVNVNFCTS